MNLPNSIIIGVQKAGTTSLFDWIGQHPDVYAHPGMKDYDFFINDEIYNNGLDWFSKAFSNAKNQSVILHGHINYIYFPIAANRIYEFNKNIKLLIVLRHPVDRAYSAYWDARKVAKESCMTFEEALSLEKKRIIGSLDEQGRMTYVDHGFYAKQLKEYYKLFTKEQIKIILFEDLINKPEEKVRECFQFLEVDDSFIPSLTVKNESGLPRSLVLQKILQNLKIPKFMRRIISPDFTSFIKTYLIRTVNIKKQKYPKIEEKTYQKLNSLFSEEIDELEKITGLDLRKWKP